MGDGVDRPQMSLTTEGGRMSDAGLSLRICPGGDTLSLVLAGEVDLASAPILEACLEDVGSEWAKVRLDLARVTFLDSSGIAVLVRAHQRCREAGQILEVRNALAPVRRTLELTGLPDLFLVD
jgi:anti-anti-sigma factor